MPAPFRPFPVVYAIRWPDSPTEISMYDEQGQRVREVTMIEVAVPPDVMDMDDDRFDRWCQSTMTSVRDLPPGHPVKLSALDLIDAHTQYRLAKEQVSK